MRSTISLAAVTIALAWAAPSGAQMMCGAGQTGSTTATSSSAMMCGMMRPAQAQAPATGQQSQPQRQGMCACCQQMAMMRPSQGNSGSMEDMMRQHFPQEGTPETPRQ